MGEGAKTQIYVKNTNWVKTQINISNFVLVCKSPNFIDPWKWQKSLVNILCEK